MEKKLQFWEISKKKIQNFHDFHEDSILAKIRDFPGIFRDFSGFWNPGPGLGFGILNPGFKIPDLMEPLPWTHHYWTHHYWTNHYWTHHPRNNWSHNQWVNKIENL